jgi:hypothetical protein
MQCDPQRRSHPTSRAILLANNRASRRPGGGAGSAMRQVESNEPYKTV